MARVGDNPRAVQGQVAFCPRLASARNASWRQRSERKNQVHLLADSSHLLNLGKVDYLIFIVYFAFVLGIGVVLKRYIKTGGDFLMSGRSVPAWVAGLAFISANLGAQEVIGMAHRGAKYGIMTRHFYWLGAIPAMVFLGVFMMPFYYGSKARSVPEYLKLRFDEKTRGFNAFTFAFMTIMSSGISMYALVGCFWRLCSAGISTSA